MIVLAPDLHRSKLYNRWQGPASIVQVKSPYSYIVEMEGKKRHIHANKMRRFHERIEHALVNNCSIVYKRDEDFGPVHVVEKDDAFEAPPSKQH